MFRQPMRVRWATAAAALIASSVIAAPSAGAAGADQTLVLQNGQIRCLVSADYERRGRPAAVCGRSDGAPFQVSPQQPPLNLAVVRGTGELYFVGGAVPGSPSGDARVGAGQTHRVNGWTVRAEELRTVITFDDGGHGMVVNPVDVRAVWI